MDRSIFTVFPEVFLFFTLLMFLKIMLGYVLIILRQQIKHASCWQLRFSYQASDYRVNIFLSIKLAMLKTIKVHGAVNWLKTVKVI